MGMSDERRDAIADIVDAEIARARHLLDQREIDQSEYDRRVRFVLDKLDREG